jgi:WD40 repeat protein
MKSNDVKQLTGHQSYVLALTEMSNNILASGSGDQTVKVWNITSARLLRNLTNNSGPITYMASLDQENV